MNNKIKLLGFIVLAAAIAGCATNSGRVRNITWTEVRPLGVPNNPDANNIFYHVAYGGGKFLVTRNNENRMMYSADGITWTEVPNSPYLHRYGRGVIAYGVGKFVVGRESTFYSADGITWTKSEDPIVGGGIGSIVYGGDKFVAVSNGGNLAYSADGVTWTAVASNMSSNQVFAYGGGKFVAGWNRYLMYSMDGIRWTSIEQDIFVEGNPIRDIAYGGGKFVAVGTNTMAYSADGVTWTAIEQDIISVEDDGPCGIVYGGGKFVAVGGWAGKMAYSTNGINWMAAEDVPSSNRGIFDIAYGNGRFVIALGEDKIAYSNIQE